MDEASLASFGSWEDDDGNDCGNDPDIGIFDLRMFRDGVQVTQPAHLWRPSQLQQGHVHPPLPPSSPLPPPFLHEESSVSSLTFGPSLPLPLSPATKRCCLAKGRCLGVSKPSVLRTQSKDHETRLISAQELLFLFPNCLCKGVLYGPTASSPGHHGGGKSFCCWSPQIT
ncbi:hypothetical protein HaLaN_20142 [Haematococcus lacustris]|uniref:Uncharacterized protein n=1 Tax=Haematococcus lacustris TaxID=44745 RepID=A0A699ZV78_HAELA|nr:hypothetical protein HaLaN_20142 [Haematococcus lacustris]